MNFEVGQELFDGQIAVLFVTDTYVLLNFPPLGDARGPFTLQVSPYVTLDALKALLDALLAVVPQ